MLAFWRHGYEGTSVTDLTAAMGITAPSLYTAFGDKKQLFLEAVRLYAGDPRTLAETVSEAHSAHDAARRLMTAAALSYTGQDTPSGCLLASATASGSAASAGVQRAVADIRDGVRSCLQARIEVDVAKGILPPTTDPGALSGLVMAVIQGMSVLARDGASRALLLAIVGAALGAWPASTPGTDDV